VAVSRRTSAENIVRPAIASVIAIISADRSMRWPALQLVTVRSVSSTITPPYAASRLGANAGASSLRCRRCISPSAVNRPWPSSGFKIARPALFTNEPACSTST
jgi:hypothetical protein